MTAGTILVVEDDRPLQDAVVTTLEAAGFTVLAAADGGEALKVLGTTSVDLIVSDVEMQPVDGRELLQTFAAAGDGTARAVDDGVRHDRSGGRRDARRRRRLSRQTIRSRRARATRCALRAELRSRTQRGSVGGARSRGPGEPQAARARGACRAERRHGAPERRERHGQGSARALHSQPVETRRGAVRCRQLRRDSGADARGVAVRPREGRLHGRAGPQRRQVHAGERRHAAARRGHGDGARLASQAPARAAGARGRAARGEQARGARRARARHEQSRSRADRARRRVPRGSLLPPERLSAAHCAAARAPRRHRRADGALRRSPFARAAGRVAGRARAAQGVLVARQRARARERRAARAVARRRRAEHRARAPRARRQPLRAIDASTPSTPSTPAGLAGELWEEETRRIVAALETYGGVRRQAAEQLGISDRTLRYKLSKIRAAGIHVPGDRAAALVEQR